MTTRNSLLLLLGILFFCFDSNLAFAQTAITTINVASTAAPDSQYNQVAPSDASNSISANTTYTVRNGQGNDMAVTSYVVGGNTYNNFLVPDTVALRRTDGSRFINIWYSLTQINTGTTPNQLDLDPRAVEDADLIYKTRNINAGYDNILVNDDDLAAGSIQAQTERVDIIWHTGIVTCEPANAVFPVVERGGNDNIRVAAITSLDEFGNPSGYTPTVLISSSDWSGNGVTFNNYLILRRQTLGQDPLPLLNIGTIVGQAAQTVQGVAVSFTELGIQPNQVVYGYSIFASDTDENTPGIDLTNINTFPTNTQSSVSGLDLVAGVTAAVSSDNCLSQAIGPGGYKAALSTWLKANVGVTSSTDGGTVTDWQDQWVGDHDANSGSGTAIYRSTSSSINFNPTVDFGSGSNTLNIDNNTDFNTASDYSSKGINLAFRTSSSDIASRQVVYEQGGGSRGMNIYIRNGDLHLTAWNRANDGPGSPWNDGSTQTISTPISSNTEYIVTLEYLGNSTSSGTIKAYLNGQEIGSLTGVGLLYSHSGGIEIGGSDGGSRFDDGNDNNTNSYFGEISEFIYCNEPGSFTTVQRNKTESYLAIKYGITLNQATPYNYVNSSGSIIFNATSSAAIGGYLEYNKDIAGIGRDDNSALEQQRSRSENTGSVVTVDHGSSFNSNNSWMVWGNNGGLTTDTETTNVPALISQRVERIWRIAETGETGNNSISFDISNLSISGSPQASDYSLLIANNESNGDFSSASIITGGSLVGNTLTFSDVDLSNGQYFSLGTSFIDCAPGNVSSNLTLWLKADLGTNTIVNGANVSSWTDQAGSNNATAPSGDEPNFASSSINYNPSLNFDAANTEELTGNGGFNSSAYYIVLNTDQTYNNASTSELLVVEFEVPATATNQFGSLLFGSATSAYESEVVTHAIGGTGTRWRRGVSQASFGSLNIDNTYLFGIKNNSGNNSTEMFINGRNYADLNSGTFLTSADAAYRIGGNLDANTFLSDNFDGQIAEIISFSARPSDADHAKIQSYLALKYGISLNQTTAQNYVNSAGSSIWSASSNASHNNDIAGIGRDDGSCLEQKQSKSEDDDSIVAIGLGGIYASNMANTNSFTADNSFLIWGNDNGDINQSGSNTSDIPSGITERMTRVWKVQETGSVGNTSVSFDLSGLGYSSIATDFHLLVSSSSTMASAVSIPGGTLNGDVITFNNIDFENGDFFTLGTAREACGPGGVTANLALWLRGDAGTNTSVDGASISDWADQSTAGRNASESDLSGASPVLPTYETNEINFNPAINIKDPGSSNASYMKTTNGNNVSDDMTLIAVFETGQAGGSTTNFEDAPAIIGGGDSGGSADYGLGISGGRLHFNAANNSSLNARTPSGITYNNFEPYIVTGTRIRSNSSGSIQLYVNSANVASGTSTNTSLTGPGSFGIGNQDDANVNSQFNGRIAEAIVFSNDLTAAERQRVESYLAIKYGITRAGSTGFQDYLAADNGIVWDWDEQLSYSHDIAGIARDDSGCFMQTKSKSENDDAIVTMEVAGALSQSDSYMLWGNDNVAIEGTRAEGNTEYNTSQVHGRLFREWYVQETGTVGSVKLTFDLASISGPLGSGTNNLNQLRLMVDNDGDFTSGVSLISPLSINSVAKTVTFSVNFTDGQFFTLGSVENRSLPITLVSFEAEVNSDYQVLTEWVTSSEENNAYFSLERSNDGLNFETIATLRGAGSTENINYYDYLDTRPNKGTNYYRLRQTDLNGSSTTSEVRRIYIPEINIVQQEYKLYPNPVSAGQALTLEYRVSQQTEVAIHVRDMRGVSHHELTTTLKPEMGNVTIPTDRLLSGIYIVVITDLTNNSSKSFKLMVQ